MPKNTYNEDGQYYTSGNNYVDNAMKTIYSFVDGTSTSSATTKKKKVMESEKKETAEEKAKREAKKKVSQNSRGDNLENPFDKRNTNDSSLGISFGGLTGGIRNTLGNIGQGLNKDRTAENNYGYIGRSIGDIIMGAGLSAVSPLLGLAVMGGRMANNIAAVNAARESMGLPEMTKEEEKAYSQNESNGFVGYFTVDGVATYRVGLDSYNLTTITPDRLSKIVAENKATIRPATKEEIEQARKDPTKSHYTVLQVDQSLKDRQNKVVSATEQEDAATEKPSTSYNPYTNPTMTDSMNTPSSYTSATTVEDVVNKETFNTDTSGINTSSSDTFSFDSQGRDYVGSNKPDHDSRSGIPSQASATGNVYENQQNTAKDRRGALSESLKSEISQSVSNVLGDRGAFVSYSGTGEYGSHRHRASTNPNEEEKGFGRAADGYFTYDGKTITDKEIIGDVLADFVSRNPDTAGVGYGKSYMGNESVHIGFGGAGTWGAGGSKTGMIRDDPDMYDKIEGARKASNFTPSKTVEERMQELGYTQGTISANVTPGVGRNINETSAQGTANVQLAQQEYTANPTINQMNTPSAYSPNVSATNNLESSSSGASVSTQGSMGYEPSRSSQASVGVGVNATGTIDTAKENSINGRYASEQDVYDYLTDTLGYNTYDATAITANLAVENDAQNRGYFDSSQKAYGSENSWGLGQWNGSRLDALKDFVAERGGTGYGSVKDQLDFLDSELKTTEKNNWTSVTTASTLGDKTSLFATEVERAGIPHTDTRKSLAERMASQGFSTVSGPTQPSSKTNITGQVGSSATTTGTANLNPSVDGRLYSAASERSTTDVGQMIRDAYISAMTTQPTIDTTGSSTSSSASSSVDSTGKARISELGVGYSPFSGYNSDKFGSYNYNNPNYNAQGYPTTGSTRSATSSTRASDSSSNNGMFSFGGFHSSSTSSGDSGSSSAGVSASSTNGNESFLSSIGLSGNSSSSVGASGSSTGFARASSSGTGTATGSASNTANIGGISASGTSSSSSGVSGTGFASNSGSYSNYSGGEDYDH